MTLDEVALLLDGAGGDQLRAVAERKLAELDALIEHTLRVRAWLEHARTCECGDLDKCPLFDDARPEARAG